MIVVSLFQFVGLAIPDEGALLGAYHTLFHSFHYLHLLFAVMGTFVAFSRFSSALLPALIISLISPAFFCTVSDVLLPTWAVHLLGVDMHMHICFTNLHDTLNVLPFMLVGLVCGYALQRHHEASLGFFSLGSHFVHILISSLAATFYIVSFGFWDWYSDMGLLYAMLVGAVVVPCTVSDIVVPYFFSRMPRFKKR